MEDIAKYVLDEAGKDKDKFILPESQCIRVDDVKVSIGRFGHDFRKSYPLQIYWLWTLNYFHAPSSSEPPSV